MAGPHDDDRLHGLAPALVGHADDGDLLDLTQRRDHVLDLARVEVVAAADDHVALAVDDRDVAVGVAPPQVAGRRPAVGVDHLGSRPGIVPVATHDDVAAHGDLTDLSAADLLTGAVDDLQLDERARAACRREPRRWLPRRVEAVIALRQRRERQRRLAQPVDLDKHVAKDAHRAGESVGRNRGGPVHDRAQARRVEWDLLGCEQELVQHRRHERQRRDAVLAESREHLRRVEAPQDDVPGAAGEVGRADVTAEVAERRDVEHDVALVDRRQLDERVADHRRPVAMGESRALRQPGGARGVEERGDVVDAGWGCGPRARRGAGCRDQLLEVEPAAAVERDHVLEGGQPVVGGRELRGPLRVRDDRASATVREDVHDLPEV